MVPLAVDLGLHVAQTCSVDLGPERLGGPPGGLTTRVVAYSSSASPTKLALQRIWVLIAFVQNRESMPVPQICLEYVSSTSRNRIAAFAAAVSRVEVVLDAAIAGQVVRQEPGLSASPASRRASRQLPNLA